MSLKDADRGHIFQAPPEGKWVIAGGTGAAAHLGWQRARLSAKQQALGTVCGRA